MRLNHWAMTTLAAALVLGLAGASLSRADDAPAAAAATGTITGKVVDKDSNPVKGATVQAYTVGDRTAGTKPTALGKSTTSAEDGTFKLEAVPAGKCVVRATTEAKLSGSSDRKNPLEVTADKETKIADPIKVAARQPRNGGGGGAGGAGN